MGPLPQSSGLLWRLHNGQYSCPNPDLLPTSITSAITHSQHTTFISPPSHPLLIHIIMLRLVYPHLNCLILSEFDGDNDGNSFCSGVISIHDNGHDAEDNDGDADANHIDGEYEDDEPIVVFY